MKSIHLLKPYFLENRLRIFLGVACLISVDFLQLLIPRVIKRAVDGLTTFATDAAGLAADALTIVAWRWRSEPCDTSGGAA